MGIASGSTRENDMPGLHRGACGDLIIPANVKRVGHWEYSFCRELTSVRIPDGAVILGDYAFFGCRNLKSVTIPASVTSIGKYAFSRCARLENVTIPDGVKTIREATFNGCRSLTDIVIPESVTEIGGGVFLECESLVRVTIPGSVAVLKGSAFSGCRSLTEISVAEENRALSSRNGVLFDKTGTVLIRYPEGIRGPYAVPDGVTRIEARAFACCSKLTGITIPEGVAEIGEAAFEYCDNLQSVAIPRSVTSIGDYAFRCCDEMRRISIAGAVQHIGRSVFIGCCRLTDVVCPVAFAARLLETAPGLSPAAWIFLVAGLPEDRRESCRKEAAEILSDSGKDLIRKWINRDDALHLARLLLLWTDPGLEELDEWIAYALNKPQTLAILLEFKKAHFTAEQMEELRLIEEEKALGLREYTRADWEKVFKLKNGSDAGTVTIADYKLDDPYVVIPARIGENAVTEILSEAFSSRDSLTNVTIPEGVTEIGEYAFAGCAELRSAVIPASVTKIGAHAFAFCEHRTIRGKAGSCAETYAKRFRTPFAAE